MIGRVNAKKTKEEPTPTGKKIYGIKRSLTTSSPEWERTDDAIGLTALATHDGTPVQNDFDDIYPWSDIYTYSWQKNTDTEIRYDEPGFNYTDDYVMTKFPEMWIKRWQDDENEYIQISGDEVKGFIKIEPFSVGRYTISGSASGVYSKSGNEPLTNKNITEYRTYAQNIGTNFGIIDWRYFIIQLLYLVEYANYDSQTILGQGVSSVKTYLRGGGCNNLGMKSGCISNNGASSVIYRGIEDIYGNLFQYIDGINIQNKQTYICYEPEKYIVNTFTGDYKPLSYENGSTSGYIKKLGYDENNPLIALPIEVGGSATTYIPDYYASSVSGNCIVLFGGGLNVGTQIGMWYIAIYTSSSTNAFYSSRLMRYK